MATINQFINQNVILNKFFVEYMTETQFLRTAGRNFTANYKNEPLRKGDTIKYYLPYNFSVGHSLTVVPQPIVDRTREFKVDKLSNIALQYDGYDITFEDVYKDPFKRETLIAQIRDLALDKEGQIGRDFANATYLSVGTPGQPLTPSLLGDGRALGLAHSIPFMNKTPYAALNTDVSNQLTNAVNNVFNTTVNRAALEKGFLGALKGFDIFETIFLPRHIAGVGAGGVIVDGKRSGGLVNGQVSTGNTIAIDGLPNSTLVFRKGDIIQVPGVYSVNMDTQQPTKYLAQFSVQADVTSSGTGTATITVDPEISVTGNYKTISASIPDNTQLVLFDSHDVGILYIEDAFIYAQPGLAPLKHAVKSEYSYSDKYRMAMTLTAGSDVTNYTDIERIDILSGWDFVPGLAVRVISN